MKTRAIGILGGMGPEASNYLYKTLIEQSITVFGVTKNCEFPNIMLDSVPVPDFIGDEAGREPALKLLIKHVKKYHFDSTLSLSLACNTAHILIDELRKQTKIPFVSMIDEVAIAVKKSGCKKVGIIASPSTLRYRLYQDSLTGIGVNTIVPSFEQRSEIENTIRHVIKGKKTRRDRKILIEIADSFQKEGAEGIILGCTEIPLLFPKSYPLPIYNSVEILSLALLRNYYVSLKMS